jgi:UDPglucose--hexose-1-phosphate uridylyltransferase
MTSTRPHRRQNLLTGDWVLVSPQRMARPWQGEANPPPPAAPSHDPACHLCPGNARADGRRNPDYAGVFVFANDFPALLETSDPPGQHPLFREAPARGEAQVICYAPDHGASLGSLGDAARRQVIDAWAGLSATLGARWGHVQIFENRGGMMGASSPHPHGQVWASDFVPSIVVQEDARQRAHHQASGGALLADVAAAELAEGTRVVAANAHWLAVLPHWAAWPFEMLLIARDAVARLEDLDDAQRGALSELLGRVLRGCDALFAVPFPYSLGWHGAPHALGDDVAHWRLHAHLLPPLLRSASVRKHMVGFELLAEAQRDLTPEAAAARLRAVLPEPTP